MIDWLNTIDTQVFLALNGLHAPYFDVFMKLFTGKWIWVPMYAAVLFAVVRNYRWRQTLAVLVCVALAITIADQVCATLIRPEVCRLRPSNPENPLSEMVHIVGGYRGGSYGTRVRDKRGLKRRDSDADKMSGDHGRGRLICF